MDSEALREAAEMAGLVKSYTDEGWAGWGAIDALGCELMGLNHPALPSYVADLLVAKVREGCYVMRAKHFVSLGADIWRELATPAQRITAAMAVLKGVE